jgi:hypothetical protein
MASVIDLGRSVVWRDRRQSLISPTQPWIS